ncbi:LysM peptidoglycan-binding domain-containing protein [Marivirga sp. S37H4]|uniref:LysM peptidoglycan-binding domain-containing protein n=1 Tax=Marivirga aurantiaca TaxID=2802615 RepID=A0A935C7X2_9BACT|nr:lytic transglycosylase domain-containing protein [Marivirga aurantiaca]MBK6265180.1 LysM peptidoglycan-binding domain-containing protein [Marivirga aurantiaca]
MKTLAKHIMGLLALVCFANSYSFAFQADILLERIDSTTVEAEMPHFKYEYVPDVPYVLIEERLKHIENEIPLTFNNTVKSFVDYFTVRNREYTKGVAALQTKYFPMIEYYLKAYGLPDELKYLSIVESGLNPKARSRAGAVGLWQFMPLTGRVDYGLSENWYYDEKMDMEKATIAACRYLTFLYKYFNQDWHLALAAYNSGPGNIRKAIRQSGYKKTFWEIYPYLLRETRSYVPQFIAVMYSMNYMEEHNMFIEDKHYLPEYDTLHISGFVNLPLFAEHTNICLETLEDLNPELKRNAIAAKQQIYHLRVPKHEKERLSANKLEILNLASKGEEQFEKFATNESGSTYGRQKLVYRVQSGDVLGTIANRYNVKVSDIRHWNKMSGSVIRIGQPLTIWVGDDYANKTSKNLAGANQNKLQQKQIASQGGTYRVQPGDTLWDISRKFDNLTIEKLKKLNNLEGNSIKPGQILKVG